MKRTIEEKALAYLEKDRLSHIDMIEVIRRGFARIYYAGEDGVAMQEGKMGTGYLSAADLETGKRLLTHYAKKSPIILHQEFMVEPAIEELSMEGYNQCYQMVYLKKEKAFDKKRAEKTGITISQLGMEWEERVCEIYHLLNEPEYIRFLLSEGVMHGAFVGEELAGFIGIHAEGCMGLLEVLREYRRRGIGEILEQYMIDWNLERGYVPFCQVFVDNAASWQLQKKLGLTKAPGYFWWVY